tara:strand:+ start:1402 stop:1593 length:192 start_codon:yes stop_codon:yes gene_type:complete
MIALEKANSSLKYGLRVADEKIIITNSETIKIAARIGAIRLFTLSVIGSALPMPPHDPHNKPK